MGPLDDVRGSEEEARRAIRGLSVTGFTGSDTTPPGRGAILQGLLLLTALVLTCSCTDTLPPRLDPQHVFEGSIEGRYVLRTRENNVEVCIAARNIYNETLQAAALLSGTIRITLKSDTSFHRTVPLSPALLSLGNYDSTTHILTVDPGAPIHLRYLWDFIDDSSRDVRQAVFVYSADPSCAYRRISADVTLTIAGSLRVFDHTGVIPLGPIDLTFRHVSAFVDGRTCPTIETDGPCGLTQ